MLETAPSTSRASEPAGRASTPARRAPWQTIVVHGAVGGVLLAALRWVEYRYLVLQHSFEIYGGLVAVLFAAVGIWLGTRLSRRRAEPTGDEARVAAPAAPEFRVDEARRRELGVTARELEVLGRIAAGLSTREIAERLFVSENTVKTHSSRLFDKLGARRRTEAVRLGKELGLIP